MSLFDDLLNGALSLPEPDRAALASRLLASLEPDPADPDAAEAWRAEMEDRLARVEQGQYAARDWREALAEIRRQLGPSPSA